MTNTEEALYRAIRDLCDLTNNEGVYLRLRKELVSIAKQEAEHEKFLDSLEDEVNPSGQD